MTPDGRLHGWKAIAAYLDRTPRTVQRWRHRGLPIRSIGDLNGSVYAVKAEIDQWIETADDVPCPAVGRGSLIFRTTVQLPRGLPPGAYAVDLQVELQADGTHSVKAAILAQQHS